MNPGRGRRSIRIACWNVNSVRARLPSIERFVKTTNPDVLCLQETKVEDSSFPLDFFAKQGFTSALLRGQRAYHGVAILSRFDLGSGQTNDWCGRGDARHITGRLPGGVILHNFYVPAGGDVADPQINDKFAHKLDFLDEMIEWSSSLDGPAILLGDLNVAPSEDDVWSAKALRNVVSFTEPERRRLQKMLDGHAWVDTHRLFSPRPQKLYSWWSYRSPDWTASNRGRRLDHVWVSPQLAKQTTNAEIWTEARGWDRPSDHAPLLLDIRL